MKTMIEEFKENYPNSQEKFLICILNSGPG